MYAGQPYGFDSPFTGSEGWVARYGTQEVSQFKSAQMIADKWEISREEMEAFSLESHRRARAATDAGFFEREIIPFEGTGFDETIRNTSMEAMAGLEPLRPAVRSLRRYRAKPVMAHQRCSSFLRRRSSATT